jgi:hypothetical protein
VPPPHHVQDAATRVPLLPKVRGQFAEFLDRGSLAHLRSRPRAYLCRCAVRADRPASLEAFLGGLGPRDFRPLARTRASRQACCAGDLPPARPPYCQPGLSSARFTLPTASPLRSYAAVWCRNLLPACHRLRLPRPRLRSRLTLGRLPLPRNPQAFGGSDSHRPCVTHSGIRTSLRSTGRLRPASLPRERSPTKHPSRMLPRLRWSA